MRKADCHARAATIHSSRLIERPRERHARIVTLQTTNQTARHVTSNTSSTRAAGAPPCFSHKKAHRGTLKQSEHKRLTAEHKRRKKTFMLFVFFYVPFVANGRGSF